MKVYYLTIYRRDEKIVDANAFSSYEAALAACLDYYRPRNDEATLEFRTKIAHGSFYYAVGGLWHPSDPKCVIYEGTRLRAMKQSAEFDYDDTYSFIIDTEKGLALRRRWEAEDEEDEKAG